jgi:hypothetical protein
MNTSSRGMSQPDLQKMARPQRSAQGSSENRGGKTWPASPLQCAIDSSSSIATQRKLIDQLFGSKGQQSFLAANAAVPQGSDAPIQRVVTDLPNGGFYSDVTRITYETRAEAIEAEMTHTGPPQPLLNPVSVLNNRERGLATPEQQRGLQQQHNPVNPESFNLTEYGLLPSQATNHNGTEMENFWHLAYEYGGIQRPDDDSSEEYL